MRIDCHVHVAACTPGHGMLSERTLSSFAFRFMRWKFSLPGNDEATERGIEAALKRTIDDTPQLDAAVVLAFDAVHDGEGRLDESNTHFYVTNDYVMELVARHSKMLFGASIHPYRRDAVAELERCVKGGAVLLKWLPITQDFDPADERCFPFYEALAHFKIPLLSHTGGEQSLPRLNDRVRSPLLLKPALERGVTIIAAHCGTRSTFWETDYLNEFMEMAQEYEHFYGDTSALNLPTRNHAFGPILANPVVRKKLVHGSDWPIIAFPPFGMLGYGAALELMSDPNWMRRDISIKRALGFDEEYFQRAGKILKLPDAAVSIKSISNSR